MSKPSLNKKTKTDEYKVYQKYIHSKMFDVVKDAIFKRDNYSCSACGWNASLQDGTHKSLQRKLQCHHKVYTHLYHELEHLEDLTTLCNVCHRAIHGAVSNMYLYKLRSNAINTLPVPLSQGVQLEIKFE